MSGPWVPVDHSAEIGYHLVRAGDARPEPVRFLWYPFIPLGAATLLVGTPGRGKTVLATELAARTTRGQLDGDRRGIPGAVVYLTGEDSVAHTLVPRLAAAGADLDLVSFLTVRRDGYDDGLALPDDLELLRAAIVDVTAVLVVVDPLMAHLGASVDSHRDHHVRRVLAPIARLADETDSAILPISHTNKGDGVDVFRRVGGSIGLTAAVRSLLVMADDPEHTDDVTARVLLHGKHNLSEPGRTLALGLEGRDLGGISTAGVAWRGESRVVIDDVLRRPEPRPRPARDAARALLEEMLSDGPWPRIDIELAAAGAGISWRSVERAKTELGVTATARRDPETGQVIGWDWQLPATPPPTSPTPLHRRSGGLGGDGVFPGESALSDDPTRHTATPPRGREADGLDADGSGDPLGRHPCDRCTKPTLRQSGDDWRHSVCEPSAP